MSDVVVAVEKLSKRYWVGHQSAQRERYTALRDVISLEVHNFARKTVDFVRGRQIVQGDEVEEFWALSDVSFEIKRGEVFGIIGRNGAGKSTLLKLLGRITEPDRGRAILRGRVGSLLEVGAGFHPELTGRENILLNGAILGMRRGEITRKFDEIVAFSETERFLDTPVKHYSSGMYVRLAFSIAAHLEPEILIIDEVLAVGDIGFQKKCLAKMQDVASKDGRTILLVSHNMAAMESMCKSAMLLVGGRCVAQGDTSEIIQRYLRDVGRAAATPLHLRMDRRGSELIRFISVSLEGPNGSGASAFQTGAESIFHFILENRTDRDLRGLQISLHILDGLGRPVAKLDTMLLGVDIPPIPPGRTSVRAVIPKLPLVPGRYGLNIWLGDNDINADWITNAATFDVESGDYYGTGLLPSHNDGMFLLDHHFIIHPGQDNTADLEKSPPQTSPIQ